MTLKRYGAIEAGNQTPVVHDNLRELSAYLALQFVEEIKSVRQNASRAKDLFETGIDIANSLLRPFTAEYLRATEFSEIRFSDEEFLEDSAFYTAAFNMSGITHHKLRQGDKLTGYRLPTDKTLETSRSATGGRFGEYAEGTIINRGSFASLGTSANATIINRGWVNSFAEKARGGLYINGKARANKREIYPSAEFNVGEYAHGGTFVNFGSIQTLGNDSENGLFVNIGVTSELISHFWGRTGSRKTEFSRAINLGSIGYRLLDEAQESTILNAGKLSRIWRAESGNTTISIAEPGGMPQFLGFGTRYTVKDGAYDHRYRTDTVHEVHGQPHKNDRYDALNVDIAQLVRSLQPLKQGTEGARIEKALHLDWANIDRRIIDYRVQLRELEQ